jgi:hypothetical protein
VAKARVGDSEFVINVAERFAILIRDHIIIADDNAIRSTKITRRLNLMKRLSELLAGYAEPVTGVLGRISGAIPKDALYICGYGSRARSILS